VFLSSVCSIHLRTKELNCLYKKLAYTILYNNVLSSELMSLFAINEKYMLDIILLRMQGACFFK
jgi:hypothetical protein